MSDVTNTFLENAEELDINKMLAEGVITHEMLEMLSNNKGSEEENEEYYARTGQPQLTKASTLYTNSPLVSYTCISPNKNTPRNHAIDTITIHEVWGECTMAVLGSIFKPVSRQASSNYGCCEDGVALFVPEGSRAWTSGSAENDNRAVTIEVSNSRTYPNAVNDKVYQRLIKLCADICKRNGKTKMVWCGSLGKTNARSFAKNEMRMTLHKWFQSTGCPGTWLEQHMQDIADKVNKELQKEEKSVFKDIEKTDKNYEKYKAIYDLGIMKADAKGNFNAKKKVTRGALAIILYRALKKLKVIS